MNYCRKSEVVEATQWFKNGDHPEDGKDTFYNSETKTHERKEGLVVRYFRHPVVEGASQCEHCSHWMHEHGWLDEPDRRVCPGDWVITGTNGNYYYLCKNSIFTEDYEEMK